MKKLVVAEAARRDLEDIARYTEREWGAQQRQWYLAAIEDRLARLRLRPSAGSLRYEIAPGYRSARSGRHVIYYRETADSIEIVRVLHDRMDVHLHLGAVDRRGVGPLAPARWRRRRPKPRSR